MSEETTDTPKPAKKAAPKTTAKKSAAKAAPPKKAAASKSNAAKKTTTPRKTVKKAATAKPSAKKAPAKKPAAKTSTTKPAAAATAGPDPKTASVAEEQERTFEAADQPESTDTAARVGGDDGGTSSSHHGFDAEQFKQAMKEKDWSTHLTRLAFVVLFSIFGYVSLIAIIVLALCQLVLTVLNDSPNETIKSAMTILGRYISDIMDYLSFQTDERPFPLGKDMPSDD